MIEIKCTGSDSLPLDAINEFQGNLKKRTKKDIEKIITSIEKYGFSFPFFIWNGTGDNYCLDGHGRIQALAEMRKRGEDLPLFPVVYIEAEDEAEAKQKLLFPVVYIEAEDEAEAKQKLLRLNSQYGQMTIESVLEFAGDIKLEFEELQLPDGILEFIDENETQEGQDGEITEDVEPTVKRGEIWQLGNHRLMCGDSTLAEDVEKLMNGEKTDMIFTDPPYNVDYSSKNEFLNKAGKGNRIQTDIINDKMSDDNFYRFLYNSFCTSYDAVKAGGVIYVTHAGMETVNFVNAFKDAGFKLSQILTWVKNNHALGMIDFNWKHEPILYGWKEGQAHYFCNDFSLTTVIDDDIDINALKKEQLIDMIKEIRKGEATTVIREDKPLKNDIHPTMKPIKLIERFIKYSSKEKELVLDLFGGSGSTLIACENLNRKCYMMELDPHYCDVIINRWETRTGQKAVKIG